MFESAEKKMLGGAKESPKIFYEQPLIHVGFVCTDGSKGLGPPSLLLYFLFLFI